MSEIITVPCLLLDKGKIISKSCIKGIDDEADLFEVAKYYNDIGADEIMLIDKTRDEDEKNKLVSIIKELNEVIEIPIIVYINPKRFEDVKKVFYAGAKRVIIDKSDADEILIDTVNKRFGEDKLIVNDNSFSIVSNITDDFDFVYNLAARESFVEPKLLASYDFGEVNIAELKNYLKQKGLNVRSFKPSLEFKDFKLNTDGMIPVITQDYKTNQVLQLAYMNEEAFNHTVESGKMTYYSRSRNELWIKGETSGHFQYVKSISADCDKDTLLAKVSQVGSACHTGARSCFFNELIKNDCAEVVNPLTVLEDEYKVIANRKDNPKEGSYTTYLFEKGMDKILKKLGEEAVEIVIAAKNNEPNEVKYEIADFLYHLAVLMAECELDWEDITVELVNRR